MYTRKNLFSADFIHSSIIVVQKVYNHLFQVVELDLPNWPVEFQILLFSNVFIEIILRTMIPRTCWLFDRSIISRLALSESINEVISLKTMIMWRSNFLLPQHLLSLYYRNIFQQFRKDILFGVAIKYLSRYLDKIKDQ